MLLIAAVVGAVAGYAYSGSIGAGVLGAILLPVALFLVQAAYGLRVSRLAGAETPIDLANTEDIPTEQLGARYAGLPLAGRNATIAREVARISNRSPEFVANLLPHMMGRARVSNLQTMRAAQAVSEDMRPTQARDLRAVAICAAEVEIAAQQSLPPNDRVRAVLERNLGQPVDKSTMARSIVATNMPRIGATIAEMIDDAAYHRRDLAFVVGTIRKVAEYHAREVSKIH